ncbi:ABC transporter substrate-binding protein [Paenibacillus sp. GCM10023252]|uniref:ABC transporter substrate-binding protein n=1 Tax=Paenibacillus sp. GCM10023252 TaxID=3252649 RepID=UPI003613F9A1
MAAKKGKQARRAGLILLAMMMSLALLLSACSSNNGNGTASNGNQGSESENSASPEPSTEPLKEVELSYYYLTFSEQTDVAAVQAEVNKITKEKINATVKLYPLTWDNFAQKVNVMSAAGDPFDLVFTAAWLPNSYYTSVAKNAFLPMDDLLDKYAPTVKSSFTDKLWDGTRVNGKIYGSINKQIMAMPTGVAVRTDLAEKYKLDPNSVKRYNDMEPFYEQVIKGEGGKVHPIYELNFSRDPGYSNMDAIGDTSLPGWVSSEATDELKVVNQYESQAFKDWMAMTNGWFKKGYLFFDDFLPNIDNTPKMKAGGFASMLGKPIKPGVASEEKNRFAQDFTYIPLTKATITSTTATLTAISRTSKNPERAAMLIELLNTDKELYNLMCFGIEGKHYKLVDGQVAEAIADSGYGPNTDWIFGNQFNAYYRSKGDVGNWEKTEEINNSAEVSPLLGFNFNPEPIKTEAAQVAAVMKEFDHLELGVVDIDKQYPKFLDKLKKAGADKIIAEKQKQLDEWLAAQK